MLVTENSWLQMGWLRVHLFNGSVERNVVMVEGEEMGAMLACLLLLYSGSTMVTRW